MKRNNKKGFTIVELVIVIAVIAILSAVLIPTFGGVVDKAQDSARDQIAKNAHSSYLIDCAVDKLDADLVIVVNDNGNPYYYPVKDGQIDLDGNDGADYTVATAITAAGFTGDTLDSAYTFVNAENAVDNVTIYTAAKTASGT